MTLSFSKKKENNTLKLLDKTNSKKLQTTFIKPLKNYRDSETYQILRF